MPRVRISLNGPWEFVPDPKDSYRPDSLPGMQRITVPGGWEHQFPGEAGMFGRAWYRKRFAVPASRPKKHAGWKRDASTGSPHPTTRC